MSDLINDLAVALGVLLLLLTGLEVGYRLGSRTAGGPDSRAGSQVGTVQGALLGLLGLLLGFSFAAAGARFLERQDLIVDEANAVGTASLRADLMTKEARTEFRRALREYTTHRLKVSREIRRGLKEADQLEIERFHDRLWNTAVRGVDGRADYAVVVLPAVNDVIDLHSTRVAAGHKHLPMLIMGLLVACSVLAVGVIGYGAGIGRRRRLALTMPLALLIGVALWVTIDLDRPRAGLLQLNDEPLGRALRGIPTE